jgi:hypothetical protein
MSEDYVLRTVSDKAEEKYVKRCRGGSWICPCCGSDELDWDGLNATDSQVVQDVVCSRCGLEWEDVYDIADVRIKGFNRIPKKPVQ